MVKASILLLAVLTGCAMPMADGVLGTRPTYLDTPSRDVPNLAALGQRIWTPALDEGFVPQGLTSNGAFLYVSSYKPTPDLKANTGPCRVFRIEKASGRITGGFDIPAGTCTHSGGLAYAGNGKLFLADTRQLFLVDLEKALASGTSAGVSRAVKITGQLRGSYATFDGKDLWIGTWTKEQRSARMFRLDPRLFEDHDGQTVSEDRAVESIPVPLEAQGAAFDQVRQLVGFGQQWQLGQAVPAEPAGAGAGGVRHGRRTRRPHRR